MIQESLRSVRTLHSAEGGDVAATLMRPEVGPHGTAQSCERLTVDDLRRLSHDLRSVTVTSGRRPAQHWMTPRHNHHRMKSSASHACPLRLRSYITLSTCLVTRLLCTSRPVKILPVQIGFLWIKSIYLTISGHLSSLNWCLLKSNEC